MNAVQALLLVWAAGGIMSREGEHMHIEGPKGAIQPPLLDVLRANKAELLAILPTRARPDKVSTTR